MDLKEYQKRALERFDRWIKVLNEEREKSDELVQKLMAVNARDDIVRSAGNYPKCAWESMAARPDMAKSAYVDRFDGAGRPIPHACIKVPTGGGKTLMAAAALERLGMRTGLVLWVVPTTQIFEQTLAALQRRASPIRQRLDHGSGGRTKILEKDDPFNKHDAEQHLCVMVLILAAANRRRNTDFLRMNRSSGRHLSFFPDSDDAPGNDRLEREHPGLEAEGGTAKRSLANVMRMLRPVVILDEAHKAYGDRKRGLDYSGTISSLNPSMVVEMSATPNPDISNLLVDVSGTDLWNEEMIKMPIDLNTLDRPDWKHTLDVAHAKLGGLGKDAESLQSDIGRYIRPIAIVRVERTGKDKRDGIHIHAEDVRKYLRDRLGVPVDYIAVQSSESDEIGGVDLMDESTPIRWIITKDALKEGWDCPFAYVLAILDNISTHTSVTQLIGRVLRQPYTSRTGVDSLDRCYIYCHRPETGSMADHVRNGLNDMGMGDMAHAVTYGGKSEVARTTRKRMKGRHDGEFLPLVLHRDGRGWRELDYGRDILSGVDFGAIRAPDPKNFEPGRHGWERRSIMPDNGQGAAPEWTARDPKSAGVADLALRLSDVVPNVWQAARIAQAFMERLRDSGRTDSDMYDGLPYLASELRSHITDIVSGLAEEIFRSKLGSGDIRFDLKISDHRYVVEEYDVARGTLLQRDDGGQVQRSLLDPVYEEEFDNTLERKFARYLDGREAVEWWHRVAAVRGGYSLLGWERDRFYPDFVVMTNKAGDRACLGIYDTKGDNQRGTRDAIYKEGLLRALEEAFNCGVVRVREGRIRGEFRLVYDNEFDEILVGCGERAVNAP